MRATGVIVRFLSLLDVALILLGVLMVTLMHAQPVQPGQPESQAIENGACPKLDGMNLPAHFLFVYPGWKGEEDGRCFQLDSGTGKIGQEIRTDTGDDIEKVAPGRAGLTRVVMLLFDEEGWYSGWGAKKLNEIEQTWQVKVVPVYNVGLPKNKGSLE